ncbi:hypothetical protein TWF281_000605 [Arthrobotrys megalospora]
MSASTQRQPSNTPAPRPANTPQQINTASASAPSRNIIPGLDEPHVEIAYPRPPERASDQYRTLQQYLDSRRVEYYTTIWKEYIRDGNRCDAQTGIIRYLDLMAEARYHSLRIDVSAYYFLAARSHVVAVEYLEKLDMNRVTSAEDRARVYLLRGVIALDQLQGFIALENIKNALAINSTNNLQIENECYYLTALWHAFSDNYVEAYFYKSLLPRNFLLKEELRSVLRASTNLADRWGPVINLGRDIPSNDIDLRHSQRNDTATA